MSSKRWDPVWSKLPPVEPVRPIGPPPAPRELSLEERRYARREYRRTHLEHVLKKKGESDG